MDVVPVPGRGGETMETERETKTCLVLACGGRLASPVDSFGLMGRCKGGGVGDHPCVVKSTLLIYLNLLLTPFQSSQIYAVADRG